MARAPSTFRQRDLTAAIKAAVAAGVEVKRVEVDRDGKVVVVIGKPCEHVNDETSNPWDSVLNNETKN